MQPIPLLLVPGLVSLVALPALGAEATAPAQPTTTSPSEPSAVSSSSGAEAEATDAPPPVTEPATEPPPASEPAAEPEEDPVVSTRQEEELPIYRKPPTPFDRGSVRVGVMVGWAQAATTDWLMLGGGAGYYVLDGLELGADANFWLIGDPFIATVTPGVRYVFHMVPQIKPYIGAFYRHYFVDRAGFDSDSIGGRAGLYFIANPRVYVGGGLVVEQLVNNNLFTDDTQVYPEITIGFAF